MVMGRSLIKLAADFSNGSGDLAFGTAAQIIHLMAKEPIPTLDMVGAAMVKNGFTSAMPAISEFLGNVLTGGSSGKEEAKEEEEKKEKKDTK